jgi:hypothetical protein
VADDALPLRLEDVLHGAAAPKRAVDVLDRAHAMKLPEVEVIGAQTPQATLEVARRAVAAPVLEVVGLRHDEDLVTHPQRRDRRTEPPLGRPAVIALRVVEEANPLGEGRLEQHVRGALGSGVAEMPAAEAEDGKRHSGAA